jgi:hypothetical protein
MNMGQGGGFPASYHGGHGSGAQPGVTRANSGLEGGPAMLSGNQRSFDSYSSGGSHSSVRPSTTVNHLMTVANAGLMSQSRAGSGAQPYAIEAAPPAGHSARGGGGGYGVYGFGSGGLARIGAAALAEEAQAAPRMSGGGGLLPTRGSGGSGASRMSGSGGGGGGQLPTRGSGGAVAAPTMSLAALLAQAAPLAQSAQVSAGSWARSARQDKDKTTALRCPAHVCMPRADSGRVRLPGSTTASDAAIDAAL